MPFAKYRCVYLPTDLEVIQSVFDELCLERRLAPTDVGQRNALAAEVIGAFESGFTDETELWQSLQSAARPEREPHAP